MKTVKLIFVLVMLLPIASIAQELKGTVTEVIDGNTLLMKTAAGEEYRILLHGIDSPEPGQRFAKQSTEMLQKLLLKKQVSIILRGRDRHGNRLGSIFLDNAPDPRHEMIRSGMAWPAEKHDDPELEALMDEAKEKNIGIWEESDPTPPWTFRRQQSMAEAKSS